MTTEPTTQQRFLEAASGRGIAPFDPRNPHASRGQSRDDLLKTLADELAGQRQADAEEVQRAAAEAHRQQAAAQAADRRARPEVYAAFDHARGEAEMAEARAESGALENSPHGDLDRFQGTRDAIRAKAAMLANLP